MMILVYMIIAAAIYCTIEAMKPETRFHDVKSLEEYLKTCPKPVGTDLNRYDVLRG